MKKYLLKLLLLVSVLLCLTVFASAAEVIDSGSCGTNLTWSLTDDGVLTVEGSGEMGDFELEASPWYDYRSEIYEICLGDGVSSIGKYAFHGCDQVHSVSFPDSMTSIGYFAFQSCSSLLEADIPDSVEDLGNCAFRYCSSLTAVTLPVNLKTVNDYMFHGCSALAEIEIPDGVTKIGGCAFSKCSRLTAVTIPDSVATIGIWAFNNCSSLTEVTFLGNAPAIGENAFANVTATCWYPANDSTWTADIKQNYGGKLTWKPYGEASIAFAGTTMTLGNDLAVNFMLKVSDVTGEGWYAEVVHGEKVTTIPQSEWVRSGGYYRIGYKGMAAKEMVDELVVTVYDANGNAISEPRADSARAYAMRMFGKSSAGFDTVLADMLNYGAAAQLQFNYKTNDLANSLMSEEQKAYASASVSMADLRQKADGYLGTSLELESNILLNFFFDASYADKTAVVSYTDHYGVAHNYEVTVEASGNMAKVSVDKLVISDCSVPVTVTVDGITVTDSVESYCFRMQNTLPLGEPLMKFAVSARAFFA